MQMNQQMERYSQLLGELLDGIDRGDFERVGQIPSQYTYEHLAALYYFADVLDGGRELYRQLHELVCRAGETAVREKAARGEKIKVTFLAISAAEWPADELYNMLEKDPRFEVTVTNCPLTNRDAIVRARTYAQNMQFFAERGYKVLDNYSVEQDKIYSWEELDEVPDIVIHLTFWFKALPKCYQITSYPCSRVNLHIPYGISSLGTSADGRYAKEISCDKDIINMVERSYVNTKVDLEMHQQHQLLQGENVMYSGYVKMDYFYQKHHFDESDIRKMWKIPEHTASDQIRKVIIAPHHSFLGHSGILFGTFQRNAYFWLYLAEKYQNEIAFVLKAHPDLCHRTVEAGLFKTVREYEDYIAKWNALPNAKVVEEGSYRELFATSDAMIMDSISFMAEYLYVDKPLLFLTRPEQAFTELGEKCLSVYSKADGSDYMEIENFLVHTVLGGEDSLQEQRRKIFTEIFDYVGNNHCLASEYIYKDIKTIIGIDADAVNKEDEACRRLY